MKTLKDFQRQQLSKSLMSMLKGGGRCGTENEYSCTVRDSEGILISGGGFCGDSIDQVATRINDSYGNLFDLESIACY